MPVKTESIYLINLCPKGIFPSNIPMSIPLKIFLSDCNISDETGDHTNNL